MTDSPKPPSGTFEVIAGKIGRIIEVITGKIGQITALLLAIAALVGAWEKWSDTDNTPPPPDLTCFHSQLRYPEEVVYLSRWSLMKLDLIGRNDCPRLSKCTWHSIKTNWKNRSASNHRSRIVQSVCRTIRRVGKRKCWRAGPSTGH